MTKKHVELRASIVLPSCGDVLNVGWLFQHVNSGKDWHAVDVLSKLLSTFAQLLVAELSTPLADSLPKLPLGDTVLSTSREETLPGLLILLLRCNFFTIEDPGLSSF
jgi:hypothetical protein